MDTQKTQHNKTKEKSKAKNEMNGIRTRNDPTVNTERKESDITEDDTIFDSQPDKRKSAVSQSPQNVKAEPTPVSSHGVPSECWEASENKLRALLNSIRDNLAEMSIRSDIQKSVSRVITRGMRKINEAVDVALYELKDMRRLRKMEERSGRKVIEGVVATPLPKKKMDRHIPSPINVPLVEHKRHNIGTWAVVTSRRNRVRNDGQVAAPPNRTGPVVQGSARPKPRPRRGAVLVKPADGKTYAEIVRTMKMRMEGSRFKERVHTIRKTKDGAVLVQLEKEEDRSEFQKALQNVIGQKGQVKDLTSKVTLEFLDLDCETTAADVADAINSVLGSDAQRGVHVFGENSRGQTLAVCEFSEYEATKLSEKGRIKVGWVNCRVRQRIRVQRCHRCLGYGHLKADCKGPDRHDCCWRCGVKGHVGKDCKSSPACFLCAKTDNRHLPGTGSCAAFRAALAEAKRKISKCL